MTLILSPNDGNSLTKHRRGVTCQITAFEVPSRPSDPDAPAHRWMAVATAQVYDRDVKVPGLQPGLEALAGETMRVLSGRAFADTEAQAMVAALEGLLFELTGKGFSANHDVKLW